MGKKCGRCLEYYTRLIARAGDVYKAADEHDWEAADMYHSNLVETMDKLGDAACVDPGTDERLGDAAGRIRTSIVRKEFKELLRNLDKIWTGNVGVGVREDLQRICQME